MNSKRLTPKLGMNRASSELGPAASGGKKWYRNVGPGGFGGGIHFVCSFHRHVFLTFSYPINF